MDSVQAFDLPLVSLCPTFPGWRILREYFVVNFRFIDVVDSNLSKFC